MSLSNSTYHSNKTIANFSFFAEKTITKNTATKFLYEKDNHLGNVQVVISDRKLPVDDGVYDSNGNQTSTTPDGIFDYFEPDVVFAADYYDGVGMVMPGRLFVTEDHRYGAQGSEVDQEIDGTRDRITTYYRQGNLKTMRWDSPDPKTNASWSPYAMMQGNPVLYNDVLGDSISSSIKDEFNLKALNQFMNTGVGKKYLGNFAAKGQTIAGHTFKKDGKYHKKGVDLNLQDADLDDWALGLTESGTTNQRLGFSGVKDNGRLQINAAVNTSFNAFTTSGEEYQNAVSSGMNQGSWQYKRLYNSVVAERAKTLIHELFIHTEINAQDFMDNGRQDASYLSGNHHNFIFQQALGRDVKFYDHGGNYKPVIININASNLYLYQGWHASKAIHKWLNTGYSDKQIYNRFLMQERDD